MKVTWYGYVWLSILIFCFVVKLHAKLIDPVLDFRPPVSLQEHVQSMLCKIESLLHLTYPSVERAQFLESLHVSYDELIRIKHQLKPYHTLQEICRNDHDYLQSLIDRLNHLIQVLENDDEKKSIKIMLEELVVLIE